MDSMRVAKAAAVSTAMRASAMLVMTDIGSALRCGVARLMTPPDFSGVKRACARGARTPVSSPSPEKPIEPLDDCACEPAGQEILGRRLRVNCRPDHALL